MQPTELRFYRDESGLTAASVTLVHPPREDGVIERTELYVPAVGWFKETINDLHEGVLELIEMSSEKEPGQ